jgi:hypothetical protein
MTVERNILAHYGTYGIGATTTVKRVLGRLKDNFVYSTAAGSAPLHAAILDNRENCDTSDAPFADANKVDRLANHYRLSAAPRGVPSSLCDGQVDYSDAGAVQVQPPPGGGLLVHGGMTGGLRG